jgi:hypothetical protein
MKIKSMCHIFDVDTAIKYGMKEAVIISNFQFWISKNYAEGINQYDGRTWTYNTVDSLLKLFPYMTLKSIRNAIENLIKNDVLIKGNYNKVAYDRTIWYAFKNENEWLSIVNQDFPKRANGFSQKGKSILPEGQIESPKTANGFTQKGEPIPDSKPDSKPDINILAKAQSKPKHNPLDLLLNSGLSEELALEFIQLRKNKRALITPTVINGIAKEADKAGITISEAITHCIVKNWQSFNASWYVNTNHKSQPQISFKEQDRIMEQERQKEMLRAIQDRNFTNEDINNSNIIEVVFSR